MRAADLSFAPADFLRLIEEVGLTGTWGWVFASDLQTWSPGLYRLLGLDPARTRPSYDLLASLVHPDDRLTLASAADLAQGYALPEQRARVMRPDGTLRVLALRTELHLTPDGRPRAAAGIALDVTDPSALLRLRQADLRRRSAWFAQRRMLFVRVGLDQSFDFPPEAAQLTGRPLAEVNADPFADVVPDERSAFRDSAAQRGLFQVFQGMPLVRHRNREPERYRIVSVPVRDECDRLVERSSLVYPAALGAFPMADLRQGLEQAVDGHHLRAARALLDWSMTDLAQASGLSLSTVRRLEEGEGSATHRSRHQAIGALRHAGIRFILLDDGGVAVART
ncbi:helix-turn-helix domain-containing protein [Methylobacterium terricola]|uniref:histidine kinase n=1 Tax=Methylobacterium terricola TaxID=2583531 RepID=A0A5C4LJ70_9HYPH|nr:PAS domain-containing protein [Methylobacterium terricola]TNC13518.1 helix-turn-helix domain-containing protein [Methylobacterium terricola]